MTPYDDEKKKPGLGFMPNARKALAESGAKVENLASQGRYGAAAMQALRSGAATVPKAIAKDVAPNTSMVLGEAGRTMGDLASQGRYGAVAGEGVRAGLALAPAVLDDTLGAGYRAVAPGVTDFGKQVLGMNDNPATAATPAAPTAKAASVPNNIAAPAGNVATPSAAAAQAMAEPQTNTVTKTVGKGGRVTYSGENITEGFAMQNPGGAKLGMRGGVSTVPGMSQAEIDRTLTNPNGTRWSANDNAIMAANIRDGVDPYRGTSRAQPTRGEAITQQMLNRPGALGLNPKQIARAQELGMQADQADAQTRLGMRQADAQEASARNAAQTGELQRGMLDLQLKSAQQLAGLQERFMAEQDSGKRAVLASQIRALSGKDEAPDEWQPTRVSTKNPDGTQTDRVVLTNKRTGETRDADGGGAAEPAMQFEVGQTYTDESGNKARWNGQQFVPVK